MQQLMAANSYRMSLTVYKVGETQTETVTQIIIDICCRFNTRASASFFLLQAVRTTLLRRSPLPNRKSSAWWLSWTPPVWWMGTWSTRSKWMTPSSGWVRDCLKMFCDFFQTAMLGGPCLFQIQTCLPRFLLCPFERNLTQNHWKCKLFSYLFICSIVCIKVQTNKKHAH